MESSLPLIILRIALIWILGSMIVGCGSGPAASVVPKPSQEAQVESGSTELPEISWAAEYGGNFPPLELTDEETTLWNSLSPSVHCTRDDRLTAAARYHAAALLLSPRAEDAGESDQLRFTLQKLGLYDYKIKSISGNLDIRSSAMLAESFLQIIENTKEEWTHCGLGIAVVDGRKRAVWIGINRTLQVDPFPTFTRIGEHVPLVVHAPNREPVSVQLFVGLPDMSVIRLEPIYRNADGVWEYDIPVHIKGRLELELLQNTGNGPETVILVPIFADVSPDKGPKIFRQADALSSSDPRQELFRLLNNARRKYGVGPLVFDSRLNEVAKRHSEDMATGEFFGHISPIFGSLTRRLAAFHILYSRVGENIALGATAFRIHHKLMESPAHRINMLNPLFSHVGIGAVKKDEMILGTEIYAAGELI
jgi:uncharacterized protein YkwD